MAYSLERFVAPDRVEVLPSRHEVIDPYAHAPAMQETQMVAHHHYTSEGRAIALVKKASTVTIFLALLTASAMFMLTGFFFFAWLFLASLEWLGTFVLLAILDWRETPAAHLWHKTEVYADLMRREQRARLKKLYGYEED